MNLGWLQKNDGPYSCKYCGKEFPDRFSLGGHVSSTHGKNNLTKWKRKNGSWNKGLTIEDSRVRKNTENATRTIRQMIKEGRYDPTKNFGVYAIKGEAPPAWNKGKSIRLNPEGEFMTGNTPWNKGLPPEEQPCYGRELSQELRQKISERLMGHDVSKETREKIKEARLNQVFPTKDSSIEIILQNALKEVGLKFTTHYPVIGQPDIVFLNKEVAVFCDGCYWHCCPVCGPPYNPHHKEGKDEGITKELESMGWTVLRFWGHEIRGDVGECVKRIEMVM